MKVKRRALFGSVTVYDRFYQLPAFIRERSEEAWRGYVWVDDDGVTYYDDPEHGVYTAKRVSVFWPTRNDFLAYADLDEGSRKRVKA